MRPDEREVSNYLSGLSGVASLLDDLQKNMGNYRESRHGLRRQIIT